ncbi:MAG TPA: hypothetical protein VN132_05275, partial [Bdellovibrio sp.]|nr:hypothetical protein [Bdellovibrio sp.]
HSYIEDGKEIHRLLGQTGVVSAKMENDSLAVKAPISLPAIPKRGQLVLGVELRPIDAPPGLSSFDGIYILGDYDQIKGSSFLRLATQVAQDKDFKLDIYVNAQLPANLTNEGANPIDLDVYQKPKVEVLALDIEFRRADNEKTSTRDRIFNIKACLKNGIDQKSIGGHSFKVTHLRQSETETASLVEPQPKTDNNACLNWEEKITIKPYDCEHYIKGSIKIENSDLGMSETLSVLIDPWEKNGVGYDERYMSSAQNLRMDCQKEGRPSPRIGMNSFSYTTDHFRPSAVDNLLNLTMQKTIKLQLDPYVLNYSAFNAARDGGGPKLRDGIYLLNMVLVNNNDRENTNTYVASTKKLVAVANGSIATDLTFETQNLKSFGNRNNILIKIDPVDESKIQLKDNQLVVKQAGASLDSVIDHNSGLESYPFVGNIILTLGSDSPRLTPLNPKNIADVLLTNKEHRDQDPNLLDKITSEGLAAQNKHIQTLQAVANNPSFAKANNLSLVSLNNFESSTELTKALQIPSNLPDYALRKNELQNIINNRTLNKEIAKKLCVFWAREFWPQMYKEKGGAVMDLISTGFANDCFYAVEKDPSVFFQLERRLNVKEVSSELPSYGSRNFGLGVGTNFSLSQSNNFNFSRGVAFKAGLSKKFLDLFSIAAEGSMGFTWSDTTSSANAISANTQTTLNVYRYTVKAIANKYEPCAVVKINPSLFFPKGSWFSRFLKKDYLKIFNSRLNEQEQGLAATRGLMICEGQV